MTQSRSASFIASLSVRDPLSTGTTLRAEQLHATDVGRLALHVLGAHVDLARQAEEGARRGRGDAVLAGAGLGDDARLAHLLREQHLAERVVDLVRARVAEVLALEPEAAERSAVGIDGPRQAPGFAERRGAADVGGEEPRHSRWNASLARAMSQGLASSSRAGTSVSATKRPPKGP